MARSRVLEWLRSGWRIDAPDSSVPTLSARCSTLVGRAQLANFLAERTFRPSEALPFSGADAVAGELAREAIYWALSALRELKASKPTEASEGSPEPEAPTLAELWSQTDPDLLDRAAGGPGEAERLRAELLSNSFADFAELSPRAQAAAARRLHEFAERLVEPLAAPQRARERAWVVRFQLLLAALGVLAGLAFVIHSLTDRYGPPRDLASSASWKASSLYSECWCTSPEQSCEACPNFFFHTLEDDQPSVVFDLHRVEALSGIEIENRRDCCYERALPLIVQVSTDQKHWKTVATRKEEFTTWKEHFPTERARWVKVSVGRKSYLHLAAVRLLP